MTNTVPQPLTKAVFKRAEKLGFTRPRMVDLLSFGDHPGDALRDAIAQGHHATMSWLEDTYPRRKHPLSLWPDARSAIVVGLNYGPDTDPMLSLLQAERGTISVYARNRDYHDIMKGRLKELAALVARDTQADVKVFVDTAPLMEKPLAGAAGLGWQGKHTNLVSRDYGSWLFLGVILSAATLTPDAPEQDHCGSCRSCLDICPTDAFPAPYKLDARRCISYLTIEHSGPVDLELREKMGNRIYGCDDCLAVCPWNKFAEQGRDAKLQAREDLNAPHLEDLSRLTDAGFRQHFSGSPIKRIGHARFIRNVLYAIGNSGNMNLRHAAEAHLNSTDATVSEAAEWACERLSPPL